MRRFLRRALPATLALLALMPVPTIASSVDESIVDTTAPTGSVTLAPTESGAITINLSVTGNQVGSATFDVYRNWTLSAGAFSGANPQTFTVPPRGSGDPPTTFSTSGSVNVAAGQANGTFTLAVGAFNIANTNTTGAKLGAGASSSYLVTVSGPPPDTTAPKLSMPAEVNTEATSAAGAAVSYTVSATDPDNSSTSLTVICSPSTASTFALGTTPVACSASDPAGNKSNGSFNVTVVDTTPPAVTVPADLSKEATSASGATAAYSASATDLVDGSVAVTCNPASGSTFPLGDTTVSCGATDAHNNSASKTFKVTVVDTTPPAITVPANMTIPATSASGAAATYVTSATDLVDGSVTPVCSPASGSTFDPGATSVTCTATDSHGNSASKSFTVTVHFDLGSGFLRPVVPTGTNMVKAGSTVPLKWQISNEQGGYISSLSIVSSEKFAPISGPSGGYNDATLTDTTATGTTGLRYDTTANQYVYNWKTPSTPGFYTVVVELSDGTRLTANFQAK